MANQKAGTENLVPMRLKGEGEKMYHSPCVVGHKLKDGWKVVDAHGNTIAPKEMLVARRDSPHAPVVRVDAIDPGPGFNCCFEVKAPPQCALVFKAGLDAEPAHIRNVRVAHNDADRLLAFA